MLQFVALKTLKENCPVATDVATEKLPVVCSHVFFDSSFTEIYFWAKVAKPDCFLKMNNSKMFLKVLQTWKSFAAAMASEAIGQVVGEWQIIRNDLIRKSFQTHERVWKTNINRKLMWSLNMIEKGTYIPASLLWVSCQWFSFAVNFSASTLIIDSRGSTTLWYFIILWHSLQNKFQLQFSVVINKQLILFSGTILNNYL